MQMSCCDSSKRCEFKHLLRCLCLSQLICCLHVQVSQGLLGLCSFPASALCKFLCVLLCRELGSCQVLQGPACPRSDSSLNAENMHTSACTNFEICRIKIHTADTAARCRSRYWTWYRQLALCCAQLLLSCLQLCHLCCKLGLQPSCDLSLLVLSLHGLLCGREGSLALSTSTCFGIILCFSQRLLTIRRDVQGLVLAPNGRGCSSCPTRVQTSVDWRHYLMCKLCHCSTTGFAHDSQSAVCLQHAPDGLLLFVPACLIVVCVSQQQSSWPVQPPVYDPLQPHLPTALQMPWRPPTPADASKIG